MIGFTDSRLPAIAPGRLPRKTQPLHDGTPLAALGDGRAPTSAASASLPRDKIAVITHWTSGLRGPTSE